MDWNYSTFLGGSNVDDRKLFVPSRKAEVYVFKFDFIDTSDTRHYTDIKVSNTLGQKLKYLLGYNILNLELNK